MEQIAEQSLDDIDSSNPEYMFGELDSAMDSFMFRWSLCLSQYKFYFTAEEHRPLIHLRAKNVQKYLDFVLQDEIPLNTAEFIPDDERS